MKYEEFLETKIIEIEESGFEPDVSEHMEDQ